MQEEQEKAEQVLSIRGRNVSPTNATWEGEVNFITQAQKLSSLNDTSFRVEGSGDQAEGGFRGRVFEAS